MVQGVRINPPTGLLTFVILAVAFLSLFSLGCQRREKEIRISGYLEVDKVEISPRVSQRILEIRVDEGDQVFPGETLILLDCREVMALLEEATLKIEAKKAKINQLEDQLTLQEDMLERFEELYRSGSFPEEKLKIQRTQVEVLKSGLEEVRKTLMATQRRLEYLRIQKEECFIRSPIEGVVLTRSAEPSELALPGIPLLSVASLDTLKMIAFLPARDMGRVSVGDTAYISLDAFPDTLLIGIVKKVRDEAIFVPKNVQTREERTRLVFEVEILIPNRAGLLKPGMFADAIFPLSS